MCPTEEVWGIMEGGGGSSKMKDGDRGSRRMSWSCGQRSDVDSELQRPQAAAQMWPVGSGLEGSPCPQKCSYTLHRTCGWRRPSPT